MADIEQATETTKPPIWDTPYRADGLKENIKAFETFIVFRDMGVNRSLMQAAEETNNKYNTVRAWSHKYKWSERINTMNRDKAEAKRRQNEEIQRNELNRINKRLESKSDLLNVLLDVLIENAGRYKKIELDVKEFASLLKTASTIENMNIADLENIKKVEKLLKESGADAQTINTMIDKFNVLLTVNNGNVIDNYSEDLKNDDF